MVELIASVQLLAPRTVVYGAALSLGVIGGAIVSHLTKLGITLPAVGDNGGCSPWRWWCPCARPRC